MGEIADYYIDRMINAQPRFPRYKEPRKHYCKTCKEEIVWKEIGDRWSPQQPNDLSKRHYCKPIERK